MSILGDVSNVLTGGTLGFAGHIISTGLKLWQERERRQADREVAELNARAAVATAARNAEARAFEAHPTGWAGAAFFILEVAHVFIACALVGVVGWFLFDPDPLGGAQRELLGDVVQWASMALAWLFGALYTRK